jgi:pyrimidine-nucleoside phosphorylase
MPAAPPSLVEIIAAKRDGAPGDPAAIERLVGALMTGELADYQMAAWLMAVFFRGLSDAETAALTDAMLRSGQVLDLSAIPGVKVDKHSTGGVGDKVSIALAPLVAACGVPVPMVCGRGLGHTGGTVDKLEAIPGFQAQLDAKAFADIVGRVGCCMIGPTSEIAPADRRMYALRDVTATVECIPLIVASILSKKLAEGIDGLVLDVKVGRGAFMKDETRARALAEALVRVGTRAGKKVVALLTDMDAPMGIAVGNAIETAEAFDVLAGGGPPDVVECTLALGAEMLVLGRKAGDPTAARAALRAAIASGQGARVAERMIEAQGGDPRVVADRALLARADEELVVQAPRDGIVARVDALAIGLAAVAMGAGRARADQPVDPGVGILIEKRPGDGVRRDEPLARLRVRSRAAGESIAERVRAAFTIEDGAPTARPLVLDRVVEASAAPPDDRSSTAAPGSG